MYEIKNVLVTGGAGYIGSHIVQKLCDNEYNVFVIDNLSLGHRKNIDERVIKFIEGDIRNSDDLKEALKNDIDAVFHFAAWKNVGESMIDPGKYADNNITGTLGLLNNMVDKNIRYFVFSSSAAVYGSPQYLPIDEQHPKNPENYYGYTKLAMEESLEWYSKLRGIKYAALRYFNATGYDVNGKIRGQERDALNLSPVAMEVACGIRKSMQIFGNDYSTADGTCIRDYIHVTDLAEAHVLAMKYIFDKNENLIVNLGAGTGSSVLDIIKTAEEVTDHKINYEIVGRRAGDPENLIATSDLAFKLLGWKAKYSDLKTIFKTMKPVYFNE